MIHKCFHTPIDACNIALGTTQYAPVVALVTDAVARLLLDMTLRKEDPPVADAGHGNVNALIDDNLCLVLLGGMRDTKGITFEGTRSALPDLLCVVQAHWLRTDR